MTGRLAFIALLAGLLWGQAYALSCELEEARRLRIRDLNDADRALERLRGELDALEARQAADKPAAEQDG